MTPYYQDEFVTLIHGDCREYLAQLPLVDLVLTDPPYGIGVDATMHKLSGTQYGKAAAPKSHYANTNWDIAPSQELLDSVLLKGKAAIIFGGNYFNLPPARCWLVWDKQNGSNDFADCELAWTTLDKPVRIKRHMWNGMLREGKEPRYLHPTQKPLAVVAWALSQASAVSSVLDPWMGTGTTLIAAKSAQIRVFGVEISEAYCEIAARRCEMVQPSFFDAPVTNPETQEGMFQ